MTGETREPESPPSDYWLSVAVSAVLLAGAAVVACPVILPGDQALLRAAAVDYVHQRYAEAERKSLAHLQHFPDATYAWLIAGESAAKLQDNERAIAHFSHVADDGSASAARALYGRAQRLLRDGYASECERLLRRVLAISPGHAEANRDLVYILGVEGRTWEALPLVQRLIQRGRMSGDHLQMALSTEMVALVESEFVDRCVAAVPEDPLPLLGRAREDLRNNRRETAEKVLREILQLYPGVSEAQARLGRLLLDAEDESQFIAWHEKLPKDLPDHPDLWVNRGLWASQHEQLPAAVRCFWEAVKLQPNHGIAHYQLSQALSALHEEEKAAPFADRARKISKLDYLLADVEDDVEIYGRIAASLEQLGRPWEAAGWYWAAWETRVRPAWSGTELQRLARQLPGESSLLSAAARLDRQLDFAEYPLPDFKLSDSGRADVTRAESAPSGRVRFRDVAEKTGLHFKYYNGEDPQSGRAYMFEFNGGGVAILDYDNDSWPDIYLTQGCHWPPQANDQTHRDRLFRNVGGKSFVDVTDAAGLGDNGFSSGVTVGDFDNDGWPDLYVCNIGPNRLYHNNGDGTFADVTELSTTAGDNWTSSAALADFNGDGLSDLYVVNYLAGPEVYTRACENDGRPVQCGPTLFPAEQDRLYLNLGDGRFQDVTETSGIVVPDGKGLGIVVADFDADGRLGVFIANDTTGNFLFRNRTPSPGSALRFSEEAMLSGVAFDDEGHAQASMGIAAGDINEDGLIDLFVTNFYRQATAMYVQSGKGLFRNRNRPTGIYALSFLTLGWGAQFIDAELDGLPDLMVVNGHINDFRTNGTPFHMRPQFLRKVGAEKFVEVPGEDVGPYFSEPQLGRSLARLDWNRDGLEDLVATHIDVPVSLLENQSQEHGHYVSIRLIGVAAPRDAIGARVVVRAGDRRWHRQVMAGDGFQASNERRLIFGLGEVDKIDEVQVFWPGKREAVVLEGVPLDREYTLLEGSERFIGGLP